LIVHGNQAAAVLLTGTGRHLYWYQCHQLERRPR
jgi:hypothetical protein